MLSRLRDLGGDASLESSADRPAGSLTQYWRAPRDGDGDACALRVGGYSSDNICLQATNLVVPQLQTTWVRENPYKHYEVLRDAQLRSSFTDEYARLKRQEWREALRAFARSFYTARMMAGVIDTSTEFDDWFDAWFDGIRHLVHLLSRRTDGTAVLGLSATGDVVPHEEAEAPPLPDHPFPLAEQRGDGVGVSSADAESVAELATRLTARGSQSSDWSSMPRRATAGPQHEQMAPYARPKMEARTALGTNSDLDALYENTRAAYGTGAGGRSSQPTNVDDEALLFAALV
jgi:hypothetical protein